MQLDLRDHGWFYLSFANDDSFLGGVIVQADEMMLAHTQVGLLGINPGGSVIGHPIPKDHHVPEHLRNRLLTKAEVLEVFPDARRLGDDDDH